MRQLPKAIPELDGGLFLPRPVLELLEAVLADHESMLLRQGDPRQDLAVLTELRQLLRFTGARPPLPPARELLGLADPRQETLNRNLLRH